MIKIKPTKEVQQSRKAALEKIKLYLDTEDVEGQFTNIDGDYYSKDRFLVSWNGTYNLMLAEFSLNKCDSFYKAYSGHACTYTTQGLFHEHQFDGYPTIWRGLIEIGMKLCSNKKAKKEFFDKYVSRYNENLRAIKGIN